MAKRHNIPLKLIANVNPNLINWKIKAKVIFNNEREKVKPISTGKICRVTLEDESGQMAGISYGDIAECIALNLTNNGEYIITGANIRKAHSSNNVGHKYELHFIQNRTEFEEVCSGKLFRLDDEAISRCKREDCKSGKSSAEGGSGGINFKPTQLAEVVASKDLLDSKKFDILAILQKTEKCEPMYANVNTQIIEKSNKFYRKKVTILDETEEVILSLASEKKQNFEEHSWKKSPVMVIAVKECVWKKYGNTGMKSESHTTANNKRLTKASCTITSPPKDQEDALSNDEQKNGTASLGCESENLKERKTGNKRKSDSKSDVARKKIRTGEKSVAKESSEMFQKKIDNSQSSKELDTIYAQGWHHSVGYLVCGKTGGTAFRVGSRYLMTAFHVIRDILEMYMLEIIKNAQSDPNRNGNYAKLLEKLNVKDSGSDVEMKIRNGILEWLENSKSRGYVKISNLLSALKDTGFLFAKDQAMEFIQSNLMYVYFGYMTNEDYSSKYTLNIDIPFFSQTEADDVALLELNCSELSLPKQFTLDIWGNQPENVYIIAHPSVHGNGQRLDSECPLLSDTEVWETHYKAVKWWKKNFPDEDPEMIRNSYDYACNERKVHFHCSKTTTHGASGSPGIIGLEKGVAKVFLMLKEGIPAFAHSRMKEKLETCPKEYLIESGITMRLVYDVLSKIPELKELRDDIFHN